MKTERLEGVISDKPPRHHTRVSKTQFGPVAHVCFVHVIVDGEGPVDRNVEAPDADAASKQDDHRNNKEREQQGREAKRDQPSAPGGEMQRDARDLIGDVAERLIRWKNWASFGDGGHHVALSSGSSRQRAR